MQTASTSADASFTTTTATTTATAAAPYPNWLQHREVTPGLCAAVADTRKESDFPTSTSGATVSAATAADLTALLRVEARRAIEARMAAASAARTAKALEVISGGLVPLATPPAVVVDPAAPLAEQQQQGQRQGHLRDIFQAACDGDCGMIEANLLSGHVGIDDVGQPSPVTYGGVQFEKRWTFAAPALVLAAAFNRERAVAALVGWGADRQARSSTGMTARDYAERRGYTAIVSILDEADRPEAEGEEVD